MKAIYFPVILFFLMSHLPLSHGQVRENLQESIWECQRSGQMEKAQELALILKEAMEKGEALSMKPLSGGKHTSFKVKLSTGVEGVFKPYNPLDVSMDYKNEVAAFEADQILGFALVPMTIKKVIDGKTGSFQYFINNAKVAVDLPEREREKSKTLKLFDFLIRGTDRNPGNYLYKNGHIVAIDHGWTFRPWDIYHQPPMGKMWSLAKGKVAEYLPDAATVARLKAIKDKDIEVRLGAVLGKLQVKDFIKRKNKFVHKAEKWLEKNLK